MSSISRVRTVFTGVAGTPWYSNMYFAWVSGQTQNHIDIVEDFWTALIGQIHTDVTGTVEGQVPVIEDSTGAITAMETGTPKTINFTGANDMLPPATQMVLNLTTGQYLGGRQLRGKIFIPGLIRTAANADGSPNSGFTGVQETALQDLIAASSSPGPLRVYSPTYHDSLVVDGGYAMNRFAVMRSRRD